MKVGGSCSCATDSSGLLGCYTAVLGEYLPTFVTNAVLPFSSVNGCTERPFFTDHLPLECGDTLFLRNTGYLSHNSAS
jgi:hypothetical protein